MAITSFNLSGLSRVTSPKAAVISGTPTGTYSSGGKNYAYYSFTGNGTLTVTSAGFVDALVIAGGGGGGMHVSGINFGSGGSASGFEANIYLSAAIHTVTVGGGGTAGRLGSRSVLGPYSVSGGSAGGTVNVDGAGISGSGQTGITSTLDNGSTARGGGGGKGDPPTSGVDGGGNGGSSKTAGATNTGGGGGGASGAAAPTGSFANGASGGSGIVIVRVEI